MVTNSLEDVGSSVPSWGVWPGAAHLPRTSGLGTAMSSKERFTMRTHSHGGYKRAFPRRNLQSPFPERKLFYQRKDRILFSWKPPALPELENPPIDKESLGTTLNPEKSSSPTQVVLLSGVPWWMTDCDIRDAASAYGQVRAVRILGDTLTGTTTGLALLEYTQKAAAENLLAEQGFGWKPYSENDRFSLGFHGVPKNILCQLYNSTFEEKDSKAAPHWSFGTFLSPKLLQQLDQLSGSTYSSSLVENRKNNSSQDRDVKEEQQEFSDSVSPKRTSSKEAVPVEFKFPFAAAAVIARVLRQHVSDKSSSLANTKDIGVSVSGTKRYRSILKDSYDTSSLDNGVDIVEKIKDLRIPYWGSSLHPPVELPPVSDGSYGSYPFPENLPYRPYGEPEVYPNNLPSSHELYPSWGAYPHSFSPPVDMPHSPPMGFPLRQSHYSHSNVPSSYFPF